MGIDHCLKEENRNVPCDATEEINSEDIGKGEWGNGVNAGVMSYVSTTVTWPPK